MTLRENGRVIAGWGRDLGYQELGSERLLLDQLHYNLLLFRWFIGLSPDDPIWHPTTFTKNRERLLNEDVMGKFLEKLMGSPEVKPLLSHRQPHIPFSGLAIHGPGR